MIATNVSIDEDVTDRIYQVAELSKVAMKVLVDNVAVQAIEVCLMTHLPDIISPASVIQMSEEQISRIASESESNQALRGRFVQNVSMLCRASP